MPLNITTGLDGIVENCIVSSIFLTCGKSTLILGFDKVTYNINLHIQDQVKGNMSISLHILAYALLIQKALMAHQVQVVDEEA